MRDRRNGHAAFSQTNQPGAAIAGVWTPLDVARSLELIYRLRHRLLAHARELGELRDRYAVRRNEREHVCRRRTDVVEPGLAERGIDVVGVLLVDQPQQEAYQRAGRKVPGFHQSSPSLPRLDRYLSTW